MKIETLKGNLSIRDVEGQQSVIIFISEYIVIQLWHNGIRQLLSAIRSRETGIICTCEYLPEVFITENLSTVDVRRHRFHLSKTSSGNLRIGYGAVSNDIVLSAKSESVLMKELNEISLKDIVRDNDLLYPVLDDIWNDW